MFSPLSASPLLGRGRQTCNSASCAAKKDYGMNIEYLTANLNNWNERVAIHANSESESYDIDSFLAGHSTLREIELTVLGDVANKDFLHLMCHFGLDTLSWARRGAKITGVDFSQEAIDLARSLAQRSEIDARFVCSDVFQLDKTLSGKFDIVFASYGVLCWIPDIHESVP